MKKVMLSIGIVVGFLFISIFVLVYSNRNNPHSLFFYDDLKKLPDLDGPQLTSLRNAAITEINESFNQIDSSLHYEFFAQTKNDYCYTGQHNWKRFDYYDNRCEIRISRFYGFNGDFKNEMLSFENNLLGSGWESDGKFGISYIIKNYYDEFYGTPKSRTSANDPDAGDEYLVSDLPTVTNLKKETSTNKIYGFTNTTNRITMGVGYAEQKTEDFSPIYSRIDYEIDVKKVFDTIIQKYKYELEISILKIYFEDDARS